MRPSLAVYVPSGRPGARMPVLLPALLLATAALGVLYQWLFYRVPLQVLQFALPLVLGFAAGTLGRRVVEKGPCRSRAFGWGVLLLGATCALAASWVVSFVEAVWEVQPDLPLATLLSGLDGEVLRTWLGERMDAGWSDERGLTTRGMGVVLAWGLEAAAVVGWALLVGASAVGRPFCERCQRWMEREGLSLWGLDREDARAPLQAGDLEAVLALRGADGPQGPVRLGVLREACAGCNEAAYLSVHEVRTVPVSGNRTRERRRVLLRHAVLSPALSARFAQRLAAQAAGEEEAEVWGGASGA